MKEISLNILDLVRNSLNAKASKVSISIVELPDRNEYTLTIEDNGVGMSAEMLKQVNDPFFTTGNKKTGLGIPLMKQHAEMAGGQLNIESEQGKGTKLVASMVRDHLDKQPLGDMAATLSGIISSSPEVDFHYMHRVGKNEFVLDTIELKQELEGIPLNEPQVVGFIKQMIQENLEEIKAT